MAQTPPGTSKRAIRRTLIILIMVVAAVIGMMVARQVLLVPEAEAPEPAPDLSTLNAYVYDEARPITPFTLIDDQGNTVHEDALKGHWTFAFIGYTYCPDICPATLSMLSRADKAIPDDLHDPAYLLISGDPERDTPERLEEYLNFFGEPFMGLTGDIDTLRTLAQDLNGVFVHREGANGEVLVDHSAHIALINPEGKMTAILQPPFKPEAVAEIFEKIYAWALENRQRTSS